MARLAAWIARGARRAQRHDFDTAQGRRACLTLSCCYQRGADGVSIFRRAEESWQAYRLHRQVARLAWRSTPAGGEYARIWQRCTAARRSSCSTHISFVLVAGSFAYKLKKAVKLPFLDFSTLDKRRCSKQELRLNRRYAPQLYLDVVPVTGSAGDPAIGGDGVPIEYAGADAGVRAKRIWQAAYSCAARCRPQHIDALAARVATFTKASPAPAWRARSGRPPSSARTRSTTSRSAACPAPPAASTVCASGQSANRRCSPAPSSTAASAASCASATATFIWTTSRWSTARSRRSTASSAELRWIDVMNEIAFLLMDLRYRGRPDLSARFLNAWLEHTGDYPGLAVLRSSSIARWCVPRSPFCARRRATLTHPRAPACAATTRATLALAHSHLEPQRPAIVITHGFSGCGKTTLSQGMLEAVGAVRIRSDIERKRLAGLPATARSGSAIAGGLYRKDMNEQTYGHLLAGAEAIIAAGAIAIVDATFLQRRQRELFRQLARAAPTSFAIVSFIAAEAELRARIVRARAKATAPGKPISPCWSINSSPPRRCAPDELPHEIRFETAGLLPIAWDRKTWRPLMDRLGTQ